MIEPVVEYLFTEEELKRHEQNLIMAEREACARVCDEIAKRLAASCKHASDAAKEIRARA